MPPRSWPPLPQTAPAAQVRCHWADPRQALHAAGGGGGGRAAAQRWSAAGQRPRWALASAWVAPSRSPRTLERAAPAIPLYAVTPAASLLTCYELILDLVVQESVLEAGELALEPAQVGIAHAVRLLASSLQHCAKARGVALLQQSQSAAMTWAGRRGGRENIGQNRRQLALVGCDSWRSPSPIVSSRLKALHCRVAHRADELLHIYMLCVGQIIQTQPFRQLASVPACSGSVRHPCSIVRDEKTARFVNMDSRAAPGDRKAAGS